MHPRAIALFASLPEPPYLWLALLLPESSTMIALLTGRIDQLTDTAVVLDVNGVGYLVQASTRTLAALP